MSAAGIAQVAVVMGSCTAGGAQRPGDVGRGRGSSRSRARSSSAAAAGEGGDGRGRVGRDLGGGDVHAHLGRRGPSGDQRRARARDRPPIFENLGGRPEPSILPSASAEDPAGTRGAVRHRSARHAPAVRRPRGDRALFDGRCSPSSSRATDRRWSPASRGMFGYTVGVIANNGPVLRVGAEGDALHRALHVASVPLIFRRTSRASWSDVSTSTAASPRTARRWCTRWRTPRCRRSPW